MFALRSAAGLALILGASSLSFAQRQTRMELQQIYNTIAKLSEKQDVKSLEKLFAEIAHEDFTSMDTKGSGGPLSYFNSLIQKQFEIMTKVNKMPHRIESIKLSGNIAILKVRSDFSYVVPANRKITGYSVSLDTWVKGPRGWKLKTITTKKEVAMENGKRLKVD